VNPYFLKAFECGEREFKRGHYPREWTRSRLSRLPPMVEWYDGSTLSSHNGEIWEIRWGRTEDEKMSDNIWMAVRRRESNKEVLLRELGNDVLCSGKFVGPNAMRTMQEIERILGGDGVTVDDLEGWM
jgi:hypothetical protein